jgi:uncharacterized protein (DUF2336 family)
MTEEIETAGLDISVLTEVLEVGGVEARIALARQLAGLLADPDAPRIERQQVIPVILKLTVDAAIDVRMTLAQELLSVMDLPGDVLFAVIADEEDVALPFLAQVMGLDPSHMLAILRVGDVARQVTIARRPDLTAEVAAYIIKNGCMEACIALLAHPAVQFSEDDYRAVHARHGTAPRLIDALLTQSDLPADIRIVEAKRSATKMRQLLIDRGWIPANDALEVVTDAEDSTINKILLTSDDSQLRGAVKFLASRDLLTPSLIVRAASRGDMKIVAALLAHLTGYSPERTQSMMMDPGSYATLFKKSGLPRVCQGILYSAWDVYAEAQDDELAIDAETFGRRLLEALMTRYEMMSPVEREKQIDYLVRFAEGRVKRIARRLKSDLQRAA